MIYLVANHGDRAREGRRIGRGRHAIFMPTKVA